MLVPSKTPCRSPLPYRSNRCETIWVMYRGPPPPRIRPVSTCSQHCANIRTLRLYSSSRSREGFSHATASADVGHVRIGEAADELRQRVRRPRRVGVREGKDLTLRLAHSEVLRRDLPGARAAEETYAWLRSGNPFDSLVGVVSRGIGRND